MDENQTKETGLFKGVKDSYNGVIVRSSMEPYKRQLMEEVLKGLIDSHTETSLYFISLLGGRIAEIMDQ